MASEIDKAVEELLLENNRLAAEARLIRNRIEDLKAALRPFAKFMDAHDAGAPASAGLHMDHFRTAQRVLSDDR